MRNIHGFLAGVFVHAGALVLAGGGVNAEVHICVFVRFITGNSHYGAVAHQVRVGETTVELTRTEFELLVALALRPGQVLTRHDLVTEVWDTTWVGDERIVDVHIGNLRRKLGTDTRGRGFIDTVRGVGYRVGQP